MARRTQLYRVMPWSGGINTSVDPGILNSQELVEADNVQFTSSGARIKRNALEYLEPGVPPPNFKASSGTTRTLKWTSNTLINIASLNERLVKGERITVTGDDNYNAVDVPILSVTEIPQVTEITCVADVSKSLAGTYFILPAGDGGSDYYVWFEVDGTGTDPQLAGRIGIKVSISENDTAATIATALASAIDSEEDFAASASDDKVTVTNDKGGTTGEPSDVNTGFTIEVTTVGGHSITYTAQESLTESLTATTEIEVSRASKVISFTDYWRFANSNTNTQIGIYATDDFQLFSLDEAGRRKQIHGQGQVTKIVCKAASETSASQYFLINAAGDATKYYVWLFQGNEGIDPEIPGRTGLRADVGSIDTDEEAAEAVAAAFDGITDFEVKREGNTVYVTCTEPGITTPAEDVDTTYTITTEKYGATAPTSAVSRICTGIFNERLIMSFTGLGNLPIVYNPDEDEKYQLLFPYNPENPVGPDFSFFFFHQGRIWADDKNFKDLLNFSETFDETKWYGFGDSGGLQIAPGDGDPEGLTNGYSYKGIAVVGKKSKRYRILGDSPENYIVELISEGMGNEGPLAIPVDQTDVIFISRRGIHSQQVTDQYGQLDAAYLSRDIKPTFNTWNASSLKYTQGAYIPELNSIAISVQEEGTQSPNAVWLYNFEVQVPGKDRPGAWYRWPNISCTALSRRLDNGTYKLVFGTADGRIIQAQKEGDFADFGEDGIPYRIKTGTIYPGDDPQSMKAFKKITMIYRPKGNFSFTVSAIIDNGNAQSFAFNQISGLDLLGETFVLGNSLLGSSNTLAPFTFTMNGRGRGITLTVTQPSANEQVEIWGFVIEYENLDLEQEVAGE